jgi:hypothetical protein
MIRMGWLNIDRGVDDDSYYNVETAGWSIGELACGIIVTCLPTLRPLFFKKQVVTTNDTEETQQQQPPSWVAPPTIGGSGGKAKNKPKMLNSVSTTSTISTISTMGSHAEMKWVNELEKGYVTASIETQRSVRDHR